MDFSAYDLEGCRKYLNSAESEKFLVTIAKLPASERAFCLTLYYSGCRISDALNLTARDIDSQGKIVIIHTLKKRHKGHTRRLPLPDLLMNQLIEICELAQKSGGKKLWEFSRTTGWRIVSKAMSDAGIVGVQATPKGLRHGFGVRAALAKIPITIIRDWTGHSDISVTAIYLEVRDEEDRELISRTW